MVGRTCSGLIFINLETLQAWCTCIQVARGNIDVALRPTILCATDKLFRNTGIHINAYGYCTSVGQTILVILTKAIHFESDLDTVAKVRHKPLVKRKNPILRHKTVEQCDDEIAKHV